MSATANPGGRYALIVAVSDYHDPKLRQLRAPAADAQRLAAVLENPEIGAFEVEVALNENEAPLRRRIAIFFANRRPEDLLLVHFSCHGVKDDRGDLYLTAADTEVGDLLGATGVSSAWLNEQVGRSRSRRVVLFLDCCFSGSFPFGMRPRAGESVDVQSHLDGRGRAVITASNAMEYSYEGDELSGHGEPSIFTEAVVEGLETGEADRDGDSWISVDELYEYVYDRVKDRTPSQTPNKLSTLEGPLRIARSVYVAPVAPARLDSQILDLVEHPVAGARLGAVDELATLLASSKAGVALSARHTLERMRNDDSRRVAERAAAALGEAPPDVAESPAAAPAPVPAAPPTSAPVPKPAPRPPRERPVWWDGYGYVVWTFLAATAGAYISTFIAWPVFNRAQPAFVLGNVLLALPVALATVGALLASGRVRAPLGIVAGAVGCGVAAGVVAGLIPSSSTHGYLALTSAIAGIGFGLGVGVLLRDPPLMAIGAVAGAIGGALSGPLVPLPPGKSAFVTEVVVSTMCAAFPVLVLLAWRNRDAASAPP